MPELFSDCGVYPFTKNTIILTYLYLTETIDIAICTENAMYKNDCYNH